MANFYRKGKGKPWKKRRQLNALGRGAYNKPNGTTQQQCVIGRKPRKGKKAQKTPRSEISEGEVLLREEIAEAEQQYA